MTKKKPNPYSKAMINSGHMILNNSHTFLAVEDSVIDAAVVADSTVAEVDTSTLLDLNRILVAEEAG